MVGYRVANANEYLVITGNGITEFVLRKKAFILPFQVCNRFCVTPLNYEVQIHALSHEKLAIKINASLTIGPNVEDSKELHKYVRLLVSSENQKEQERAIRERVTGIVEGEMRAVLANMAIEEIFNDRKHLQSKVAEFIQEALNKFGCVLYNANVEELTDTAGYFTTMGQKAQEGAISVAKVAIAEAKANGDIGAQERNTRATKETTRLKAETSIFENERAQQVALSKSELQIKEASLASQVSIATIEGQKAAQTREAELQKEVEKLNAVVATERLRADNLSRAVVESEIIKQLADAKAYEKRTQAEAALFEMQKTAEAKLFAKQQEAQGIRKIYTAQAEGLQKLVQAFSNPQLAIQYLMLEKGLYQQLAAENAKAIQGLKPKFNIWTTGKSGDNDCMKPMREIFNTLPPLLTTVQQQTVGSSGKVPPAN